MFNVEKVSFGRHETFALRYSWLSKGFHQLQDRLDISNADEATVKLGVGKNMVSSIRFWLKACRMIESDGFTLSKLGLFLLDKKDGVDPYLEDEATIWLIHWLLATNAEQATTWFWFFNKFHRPEFTSTELQAALSDFVKEALPKNKRPAANTVKNDASIIARMYSPGKARGRMPLEEALDSPLSLLRLLSHGEGDKGYQSRADARPGLPVGVLAFAVVEMLSERDTQSIPIEEIMYSRSIFAAPGSVFRLTEMDLVTKLEQLVQNYPDLFAIRETAGIHQFYCLESGMDSIRFLVEHYQKIKSEVAA
jgi:hypothetical protein